MAPICFKRMNKMFMLVVLACLMLHAASSENITVSSENITAFNENITASNEIFTIASENITISSDKSTTISKNAPVNGETSPVYSMKPKLYVGGLFSLPKDWGTGTKGFHAMVGAQMATEDINNASWILPDYEMVLLVYDAKVSSRG